MCILPQNLILSSTSPSIIQEVACRLPSCWALTTAAGKCFWASTETGLTEKASPGGWQSVTTQPPPCTTRRWSRDPVTFLKMALTSGGKISFFSALRPETVFPASTKLLQYSMWQRSKRLINQLLINRATRTRVTTTHGLDRDICKPSTHARMDDDDLSMRNTD
jgi:hypothetical protein